MIPEKRYALIGICTFLMILFATLLGDSWIWEISPVYILGFFLVILGWWSITIFEAWRGQTSQVISNRGHISVRLKDIFSIPWQEQASEGIEHKISLGSMKIMLTGGFDIGAWGMPGSIEAPVYIFPGIYCETEQKEFHVHANLTHYKFRDLPSYLREELLGLNLLPDSKDRIHVTKTPIWYGTTSHMDGSATPENLRIEREKKHENRELVEAEVREERHYMTMRKQKDADEKQFIIGKPIKPVEDE